MVDVLILAIALSMDAFAVSVGLGAKRNTQTKSLSIMAGLYFGVFQGLMPLIGYIGGKGVMGWVESYAPWIAFVLLLLIGSKMIYESFFDGIEDDLVRITHKVMLVLAVATSIDAMAAGFTLSLIDVNPFMACFIIGVTTFIFSWVGVLIGSKSGTWLENKASFLGGVTLIAIGIKLFFW